MYVQTGKGLRLANVTFDDSPNVDHFARLNCQTADKKKRRCESSSPSKQVASPVKDGFEERNNDSEDDLDCGGTKRRVRATRSPRKKKPRRCAKLLGPEVSDRINEVIDRVVTGATETDDDEQRLVLKIEIEEEKIVVPAVDSESGECCMPLHCLSVALFCLDVLNAPSKTKQHTLNTQHTVCSAETQIIDLLMLESNTY